MFTTTSPRKSYITPNDGSSTWLSSSRLSKALSVLCADHELICIQMLSRSDLHLSNDGEGSSDLLVHHEAKDAHHGGAAIVQFDGALGELGLLIKGLPAEVDPAVAEVADELIAGSGDILHEARLQESNEDEDLAESLLRNRIGSVQSGPAISERVEGVTGVVNVSGQMDSGAGHDLAQKGELGHAGVLDLHVTEVVETGLVSIVQESKRVKESKGRLGSELGLERVQGRGGGLLRDRGEGGGGAHEGGEEGKLHHGECVGVLTNETLKEQL